MICNNETVIVNKRRRIRNVSVNFLSGIWLVKKNLLIFSPFSRCAFPSLFPSFPFLLLFFLDIKQDLCLKAVYLKTRTVWYNKKKHPVSHWERHGAAWILPHWVSIKACCSSWDLPLGGIITQWCVLYYCVIKRSEQNNKSLHFGRRMEESGLIFRWNSKSNPSIFKNNTFLCSILIFSQSHNTLKQKAA